MSIDLGVLITGALIAAFSGGMGMAASFAIFHMHRESEYLSRLSDAYAELFMYLYEVLDSRSGVASTRDISQGIQTAMCKIRLIDRDEQRIGQLEKIRAAVDILELSSGSSWESTDKNVKKEKEAFNAVLENREALVESLRVDIIQKRPLRNWPSD